MALDNQEQVPEIKPEIVFIFELVRDVEMGKIRIPNFQRDFVWRREQMTDLLDSIRWLYPIGSLLIWETDTHLSSKAWVGSVHIPPAQKGVSAHVLDGQQRLSTLVGTLRSPHKEAPSGDDEGDDNRWCIWYNAKDDIFEHHHQEGKQKKAYHLPMWSLMDTIGFLEECQRMLKDGGTEASNYVKRAQDLARSFQSYKMPVIRIRNTNLNKAVQIFARLNTKGQAITADQMVAALTYREGEESFNLADIIDKMILQADDLHFGGIDRAIVLRACLVALGEDVYNTDWTRMRIEKKEELKSRFPSIIDETSTALKDTIEFLVKMGIMTDRLLPYAMQMVILMAFFHRCSNPSETQLIFLRRWIWVSSFAGLLASSPSRLEALIREFRDHVARQDIPHFLTNMNMQEPALAFPKTFDMRSARARSLLNVLLSLRPLDNQGQEIPDLWENILDHGPNALGKIFTNVNDKELGTSPANRIFRIDIKDRSQSKNWLRRLSFEEDSGLCNKILYSHGIPPEAFDDLMNDCAEDFLRKRRDHLIQLERDFMQQEGVVLPQSREPQSAPIDTE